MPWVKGQSGNPRGRSRKAIDDAKANAIAFAKHAPHALERLVELMDADDSPTAIRACQVIIERAYGKPVQPVEGTPDGTPIALVVRWEQ